ncbi:hypothetical protein CDL12_20792 [Handroanthus impetiginosus]|uniref:Uncharacterized protein n=1 Tax=Handroanthus impetiginosus TaxID=429701 RepID=A0A2G9GMW9_9LAMI|nr:hypothetical protein CDL12_20792 [Handroanthus impetiginosus]
MPPSNFFFFFWGVSPIFPFILQPPSLFSQIPNSFALTASRCCPNTSTPRVPNLWRSHLPHRRPPPLSLVISLSFLSSTRRISFPFTFRFSSSLTAYLRRRCSLAIGRSARRRCPLAIRRSARHRCPLASARSARCCVLHRRPWSTTVNMWSIEFGAHRNGSPEIHDMLADYLYSECPELVYTL